MYAKTCGEDRKWRGGRSGSSRTAPLNQTIGEQKSSMGTNEGRLISRFIVKKGSCNEINELGEGQK